VRQWITKDIELNKVLEIGKDCKQCGHCCNHTSGFILKDEVGKIAKYLKMDSEEFVKKCLKEVVVFNTDAFKPLVKKQRGKQYGQCIFYDKKLGCSIQDVKPLHCKISNCNIYGDDLNAWFMLNYFVDENDAESLRQWNVYLKSGGRCIPGGDFAEMVPDLEIRKKLLNYEVMR